MVREAHDGELLAVVNVVERSRSELNSSRVDNSPRVTHARERNDRGEDVSRKT
jgi:hypothetical protein